MALDYKLKLVEFLNSWHQYRVMQGQLEAARNNGDVKQVTQLLKRINHLRDEIDSSIPPILNTIRMTEQQQNSQRPVIQLSQTPGKV